MTVTLCLSCSDSGVHSIGASEDASVWCGLPYHIWSLLSGILLATASGVSEVPLGRVWPSLPHLVSNPLGVCCQLLRGVFRVSPRSGVAFPTTSGLYCLEFCWQLHRGFLRSPSVGCGFPYHITSLTLWESAGNCIGGFREPPRSGVAFLTTSGLYCLEFYWQLLWDPNSTELNNNSTPTRSPTGSLKSNV